MVVVVVVVLNRDDGGWEDRLTSSVWGGIQQRFSCSIVLMYLCDVVFGCCTCSALINFVEYLKQQNLRNVPFPDVLFLSHYPASVRGNWLASSILTIILVFATGYVA